MKAANRDKADVFRVYWDLLAPLELGQLVPEYRFAPPRKWRLDFCIIDAKIAIEVEGNAWNVAGGGRHMQDKDLDKYNHAAALGWRIFRFSPGMLKRDPQGCIDLVVKALQGTQN